MAMDAREGSTAETLERIETLLSTWRTELTRPEVEFLGNAKTGLAKYGSLTPPMLAWLERIWERTAGRSDEGEQEGRWA
jgi:hypothetical protein